MHCLRKSNVLYKGVGDRIQILHRFHKAAVDDECMHHHVANSMARTVTNHPRVDPS